MLSVPAKSQQSIPSGASGPGLTVQTIEVTARRRLETQFDVPASLTAIPGDQLQATGITSIQDIVALVPNATIAQSPDGTDTYISIRGMRQADVGAPANFGAYRNGIFAGGRRVNLGSQIDVARVEVVRGPQGGLYGREAVGGAVNIIYALPKAGAPLSGYASVAVENDSRARLEGAVSAPINADVAVRATAWTIDQRKGEYFNIYLNEQIDRLKDQGLRFSVAANATPSVSLLGTVEYTKSDTPALRTFAPDGVPNGPATVSPRETPSTVQRDTSSRNNIEQSYSSGKLIYGAPNGTLTLMASARDYRLTGPQDQDQTALQPSAGPLVLQQIVNRREAIRQYYTEALWESDPTQALTWRAGASYFEETFQISRSFATKFDTAFLGGFGIPNLGVVGGAAGIPNAGSETGSKSVSVFGDMRYELSKKLAVTATLRYTQDKQSLEWNQGIDPASNPVAIALFSSVVPTFNLIAADTYRFTSPSTGVEYKLDPDTNLYAIYSTGYRPGGYNTSVTNPAYIPYSQESAQNYEAGIKTRWLGGRVGLNLAAFRMNQKNLTVQQDDPGDTQFGFSYLANVGKARTDGFELEVLAALTPGLRASLTVGYLDAKYTQGSINAGTPAAVDVSGRKLQGVRPWTVNARLDFRQPVSGSTEAFGGIGVRTEKGGAIGDASDKPYDDLTRLDLNAGLSFAGRTQLTAYVRNATDEKIVQFRYTNGAVTTNPGRRYGLQLMHRY